MARFAVAGDVLYTVDDTKVNIFNIADPAHPKMKDVFELGTGIETIFPYQDKLFIGSQNGMYILDIQNQEHPQLLSTYEHIVSCDPVVTDGRYAYITLNAENFCRGINELQVVDLANINAPKLISQYAMTGPKGLGIDQNILFVCDDGLKMYDASNVKSLQLKQHFKISAYDVIPMNGHLLVVGKDGLYQYRYTQNALELLSKIDVQPAL